MSNMVRFWVSGKDTYWICPKTLLIQQEKTIVESKTETLEDRLWKRVLENEDNNPELKKLIIKRKNESK